MPPRFSYWTVLVDGQPTAFRAREYDELLPTFNRLKARHPGARMMWFQSGRLWDSPQHAQDTFVAERRAATERKREDRRPDEPPRDRKWRPGGTHRDPRQKYIDAKKAKWTRFKQNIRQNIERRRGGTMPPRRPRPTPGSEPQGGEE